MKRKIFLLVLTLISFLIFRQKNLKAQAEPSLTVNPASQEVNLGDNVSLDINIDEVTDLYSFDITISFNQRLLIVSDQYKVGNFLSPNPLVIPSFDQANGQVRIAASRTGQTPGASGSGTLLTLNFQTLAAGNSPIIIEQAIFLNSNGTTITANVTHGEINILSASEPTATPTFLPELTSTPTPTEIPASTPTPTITPTLEQTPTPSLTESPTPTLTPKATFNLSPSEQTYYLGDAPEIEVRLDTWNNPVSGVDLILHFDPDLWTVKEIVNGSIFPNFPQKSADNRNGIIKISATANYDQYFSGRGLLAKLIFEIKNTGVGGLNFEYQAGSTTDCNIVSAANGQELLNEVPLNGQYNFVFEPVLSFKYNLPHRLPEAGNAAEATISLADTPWQKVVQIDRSGIYENLSLKELILNQSYQFVIKISGYLKQKARETILLYGGANPREGYLDFGDLVAGDLNDDGIINNVDLSEMFESWEQANSADLNGDGTVNNFDAWIIFDNFFAEIAF